MNILNNINSRLKELEKFRTKTKIVHKKYKDGFIEALVGEKKDQYKKSNGSYDIMKALNDTAKIDWIDWK